MIVCHYVWNVPMYILNVVTGKILFGLESIEVCSGVLVNHQSIINEDSLSRSGK